MTNSTHQPSGYPAVSVYMMADGAQRVIEFASNVLGGEVMVRLDRDDGSVMHAAMRIGDSVIMLSDATPEAPAFPVWLHVYVPDVDATHQRALSHGAAAVQAPSEKGDGDRRGGITDPMGNT